MKSVTILIHLLAFFASLVLARPLERRVLGKVFSSTSTKARGFTLDVEMTYDGSTSSRRFAVNLHQEGDTSTLPLRLNNNNLKTPWSCVYFGSSSPTIVLPDQRIQVTPLARETSLLALDWNIEKAVWPRMKPNQKDGGSNSCFGPVADYLSQLQQLKYVSRSDYQALVSRLRPFINPSATNTKDIVQYTCSGDDKGLNCKASRKFFLDVSTTYDSSTSSRRFAVNLHQEGDSSILPLRLNILKTPRSCLYLGSSSNTAFPNQKIAVTPLAGETALLALDWNIEKAVFPLMSTNENIGGSNSCIYPIADYLNQLEKVGYISFSDWWELNSRLRSLMNFDPSTTNGVVQYSCSGDDKGLSCRASGSPMAAQPLNRKPAMKKRPGLSTVSGAQRAPAAQAAQLQPSMSRPTGRPAGPRPLPATPGSSASGY